MKYYLKVELIELSKFLFILFYMILSESQGVIFLQGCEIRAKNRNPIIEK